MEHFWDGFTPTFQSTAFLTTNQLAGPILKFAVPGSITKVRVWFNAATTFVFVSVDIIGVRQSVVYVLSSTAGGPLSVSAGWNDISLISPVIVGRDQCVAVCVRGQSGTFFVREFVAGGTHTGSANITKPDSATSFLVSTTAPNPNASSTTIQRYDGLDVEFEAHVVPGSGYTLTEISDELARWLTTGGDKYPESDLPAIKGQAEGANTNAENAWTTAQQVQTDLGDFRDEWPGTLATALQGGLTTIGDWLSTESDWYKKLVHDTAPGAASLVDKVGDFTGITVFNYLADLIRWANGVNQQPQLADTTDWELLDETDFTDNLLWPVEADVYRVTLSSFDPAGTSEPVGTETRHAYLGKWCPFNVQFSSEWHYFNTESADLYLGGRMPGLGLILYRPGAGHVQAWRRTEAP